MSVDAARRGLAVYLGLLIALSAPATVYILVARNPLGIWALMWAPGVASLLTRLIRREGLRDISLRLGGARGRRGLGLAVLYPVVIGFTAYGLAWVSGVVEFVPDPEVFPAGSNPIAMVALLLVTGLLTALGEELGWRGYMLLRLIDAGVPRPILVSGLIWAAWHLPVIIGGAYLSESGSLPVIVVLFVIQITVGSYLWAWLRLNTGSVWPAVVLHASWNIVIQDVLETHTSGAGWLWLDEQGLFMLAANIVGVLVICRGPWRMLRMPE